MILKNVKLSHTQPNEILLQTDLQTYKMGYILDKSDALLCKDSNGFILPFQIEPDTLIQPQSESLAQKDFIKSPMPGSVVKVFCQPGQKVHPGDSLVSIESMKMEHIIKASHESIIKSVNCQEGKFVQMGHKLIEFEE